MRGCSLFGGRGAPPDGRLDPQLSVLFQDARDHLAPAPDDLVRGRARIAQLLAAADPAHTTAGRGAWQRLRWRMAGGLGVWSGLLSVMAANKIAAVALGATVLLGSTVAVETGVGPAVRDAVTHSGVGEHAALQVGAMTTGTAEAEHTATATPAATRLPGNLVTQLHADGSFTVRAEVVAVDAAAGTATVTTADGAWTFAYDPAVVHASGGPAGDRQSADREQGQRRHTATATPLSTSPSTGTPSTDGAPVSLNDYVGSGVVISGTCAATPLPQSVVDCAADHLQIERVQVLGRAGQEGGPGATPVTATPGSEHAAPQGAAHHDGAAATRVEHGSPGATPAAGEPRTPDLTATDAGTATPGRRESSGDGHVSR